MQQQPTVVSVGPYILYIFAEVIKLKSFKKDCVKTSPPIPISVNNLKLSLQLLVDIKDNILLGVPYKILI